MLGRKKRFVMAAIVAIAALPGCSGGATGPSTSASPAFPSPSAESTIPSPAQSPTPPTVRYTFPDSVPTDQRNSIQQGIDIALAYISVKISPLRQDVTVVARVSGDCMYTANALGHTINVCAASSVWKGSTSHQRSKILVHELFHVIQGELGAFTLLPAWLFEGSAEYVGYSAIIEHGMISLDRAKREIGIGGGLRNLKMQSTLQSLETNAAWLEANQVRREPTFALGYAAVDLLVSNSGLQSIRTFFSALKPGRDWKTAFAEAFGLTVDAFYQKVASLRVS
jgi:hypothetical protein